MEGKYCPACNEKIEGKYCSECGTKAVEKNKVDGLVVVNWREEKDLKRIIKDEKVQAFIKSFLNESKESVSAEEFLGKVDILFSPLTGLSLNKLMEVTVPIYKKMGIKTGKSKTDHFEFTIQEVLVKLLCSLAKHKYPLKEVHEAGNGLILIAGIPSSMRTFGGEILITLEEEVTKTIVSIDAKIKGQLYDWGKSKAVIKQLYSDIEQIKLTIE